MFVSIGNTNNPADWAPSPASGGASEGTTVIAEGRYERALHRKEKNSCSLVDLLGGKISKLEVAQLLAIG